jgi:hypothetical protein
MRGSVQFLAYFPCIENIQVGCLCVCIPLVNSGVRRDGHC